MPSTNGCIIFVNVMTGEKLSSMLANIGLVYWSVCYPVGGKGIESRGWM